MLFSPVMKIELHYFFSDEMHQMDAIVRHRCEGEILKIIEEISNLLHIHLTPQTEAYSEGGLKELWTFAKNNKFILGVVTGVLINVLSEQINIDRELVDLQKESLRLEIKEKKLNIYKMKKEIESGDQVIFELISENMIFILNNDYRAIRARSDFYKNLQGYKRVSKISTLKKDIENQPLSDYKVVERDQFKKFILTTDELPKEYDEDSNIEVISPVLKRGKYKWRGIYRDEPIDFYMKDSNFKDSIFNQKISFKNGISLKCVLEIYKKMNEIGEIYVSNYSVIAVISYYDNENIIRTSQGSKYFREKEEKLKQLKLFDN